MTLKKWHIPIVQIRCVGIFAKFESMSICNLYYICALLLESLAYLPHSMALCRRQNPADARFG